MTKYVNPTKAIHPLRNSLDKHDWKRIQEVIDKIIPEHNATVEELNAAYDVFYDAYVAVKQTHYGVTSLQ